MKKTMILFALGFSSLCAAEQINTQALQACTLIENDFKRLMCYDNVIANKPITEKRAAKSVTRNNEQSAAVAPVVSATPEVKEEGFGLERRVKVASEEIAAITAGVTKITKTNRGKKVFTLDNGQEWTQVSKETFFADEGDTLIIQRASFGSFLMKKEGSNRTTRVKRVN